MSTSFSAAGNNKKRHHQYRQPSSLPLGWFVGVLLLLLLLLLLLDDSHALEEAEKVLPQPTNTSCFTFDDPPSCQTSERLQDLWADPDSGIDDMLDLNEACLSIVHMIWDHDVGFELDRHVEALSALPQNTPECTTARRIYPHCVYCLPTDSRYYEDRYEFCHLEIDPCTPPPDDETEQLFPNLDDAAVCDQLAVIIFDNDTWPAVLDLCLQAEQAIHTCDWYCWTDVGERNPTFRAGTPTNESCWTLDDPPDCHDVPYSTEELTAMGVDYEQWCWYLYDLLFDPWYQANAWTHVYSFAELRADDNDNCTEARWSYPHCQMCHPLQEGNQGFCELDAVCEDAGHRKPMVKDPSINMRETCAYLHDKMHVRETDIITRMDCHLAEMSLHACEFWCEQPYLGADTTRQKWTLVWLARTSAVLSLLGAVGVLWDVVAHAKNRQTVYHQLLWAMAVFDIITALAWSFSTAPLPVDEAWKVVGAAGNDMTCTAQAFFIQLGFTSVFYNTSLALYYVLVIVYRWREGDLKRIRSYMHAGPLVVGFGLACLLIPYADWTGYGCHVLPPPDDLLWKSLIFVVIPLGFSVVTITAAMAYMYWVVRRNSRASLKWSFGATSRLTLEHQVFWQSLLYTTSFYITWPILFAVYLGSVDYKANSFAFTATVSFVAPLQGFSNAAVYFRPRILRYLKIRAQGFSTLFSGSRGDTETTTTTTRIRNSNVSASLRQSQRPDVSPTLEDETVIAATTPKATTATNHPVGVRGRLDSLRKQSTHKSVSATERLDHDVDDDDMDPSAKIALLNGQEEEDNCDAGGDWNENDGVSDEPPVLDAALPPTINQVKDADQTFDETNSDQEPRHMDVLSMLDGLTMTPALAAPSNRKHGVYTLGEQQFT